MLLSETKMLDNKKTKPSMITENILKDIMFEGSKNEECLEETIFEHSLDIEGDSDPHIIRCSENLTKKSFNLNEFKETIKVEFEFFDFCTHKLF